MAFRLKAHEGPRASVMRIVSEEIESAVEQLGRQTLKERDEGIHEARKSLKKVRGTLKLIRLQIGSALYKNENDFLRNTGQALSELRDARAIIETFDNLIAKQHQTPAAKSFGAIRKALLAAKRKQEKTLNVTKSMSESAANLSSLNARMAEWPLAGNQFRFFSPGLKRTYRAGRRAMRRALRTESSEDFHEWRKRAKDHWYQMRLFESAWSEPMRAREEDIHKLETALGEDHNLVVLSDQIRSNPDAYGGLATVEAFVALAQKERKELHRIASALGREVYAAKSRSFLRSMQTLWDDWKTTPRANRSLSKQPRRQMLSQSVRKRVA